MNYETEIINIVQSIEDVRILSFIYGMLGALMKRVEEIRSSHPTAPS